MLFPQGAFPDNLAPSSIVRRIFGVNPPPGCSQNWDPTSPLDFPRNDDSWIFLRMPHFRNPEILAGCLTTIPSFSGKIHPAFLPQSSNNVLTLVGFV